jgi:hypothetical protein
MKATAGEKCEHGFFWYAEVASENPAHPVGALTIDCATCQNAPPAPKHDVSVERDGDSIMRFTLNTDAAAEWVEANVHLESWQRLGYRSFAVDISFAWDLAQGMQKDGLTVGDV